VSGYIDHFFVAGAYARRGVGNALMEAIHREARQRGLRELFADVSLTAEGFFARHGFVVEKRQTVLSRSVMLENARMRKRLCG
jgi:putative acetyltransferase